MNESSDEKDELDWSHLKSIREVEALKPELAAAAQKQYDQWAQDENGYDEEVGYGGICHLIVDDMLPILDRAGFPCQSLSVDYKVHVIAILQCQEGIYEIDIPEWLYETGGGYTWKKIPNVQITPNDVHIGKISSDPGDWENFDIQ